MFSVDIRVFGSVSTEHTITVQHLKVVSIFMASCPRRRSAVGVRKFNIGNMELFLLWRLALKSRVNHAHHMIRCLSGDGSHYHGRPKLLNSEMGTYERRCPSLLSHHSPDSPSPLRPLLPHLPSHLMLSVVPHCPRFPGPGV